MTNDYTINENPEWIECNGERPDGLHDKDRVLAWANDGLGCNKGVTCDFAFYSVDRIMVIERYSPEWMYFKRQIAAGILEYRKSPREGMAFPASLGKWFKQADYCSARSAYIACPDWEEITEEEAEQALADMREKYEPRWREWGRSEIDVSAWYRLRGEAVSYRVLRVDAQKASLFIDGMWRGKEELLNDWQWTKDDPICLDAEWHRCGVQEGGGQ